MNTTLLKQIDALLEGEDDLICAMANTSAAIMTAMPRLNWAGFYIVKGNLLVLGPFQGKVACTRIPLGRGVCGTVWQEKQARLVPDVHAFPGHIACDSASNAEVVVPLMRADGEVFAVLDIDSPELNRFSAEDFETLKSIGKKMSDWGARLL